MGIDVELTDGEASVASIEAVLKEVRKGDEDTADDLRPRAAVESGR